ncbi:glycosyltransferase family 39 protein [Fervidicoccus fontis]|uniref:Glycosyltransferase family 39 protein n=1 Tax=Fervidicoccus fontis TaxID=683846 RepID=A0A843A7B5_9CREN|nr:glycosyltransferase family 39 protein [Fervidicoccus fontis]MBE9390555.1 glycosyltransferase family 39 protein [Fervidicoccus fontis]
MNIIKKITDARGLKLFIIGIIICLVLSGYKFENEYNIAKSQNWYVSDEIWYVPSSVLILKDIFHLNATYEVNNLTGLNLFFSSYQGMLTCENFVLQNGGEILKGDYIKNTAIAVAVPNNLVKSLGQCKDLTDIIPGFPLPDTSNVNTYINPEHPPLGKYIIALAIYLLGDKPICWRLPGIIEGAAIVIIAALAGWRLAGIFGMILASTAASFDPLTTNMASVAMLDIHLAFFTALGSLFYIYDKKNFSLLFFSLASTIKYSGLFLIPFLILFLYKKENDIIGAFFKVALAQLIVAIIVFLPYIIHFGPVWVISQFVSAIIWNTQSRPPGPPASTPIDWVFGLHSFYLSYNPDIPAKGLPFIYIPVFFASLLTFPVYFFKISENKNLEKFAGLSLLSFFFFFFYYITYFAGNKTLYSFYFTQISPIYYELFPLSILLFIGYYNISGFYYEKIKELAALFSKLVEKFEKHFRKNRNQAQVGSHITLLTGV